MLVAISKLSVDLWALEIWKILKLYRPSFRKQNDKKHIFSWLIVSKWSSDPVISLLVNFQRRYSPVLQRNVFCCGNSSIHAMIYASNTSVSVSSHWPDYSKALYFPLD